MTSAPLCDTVKVYLNYPARPSLERIMKTVVDITGITLEQIKHDKNRTAVVDARMIFSYLCWLWSHGASDEARFIGKEHSQCFYRRNAAKDRLSLPKQYPLFFRNCSAAVAALENKTYI